MHVKILAAVAVAFIEIKMKASFFAELAGLNAFCVGGEAFVRAECLRGFARRNSQSITR